MIEVVNIRACKRVSTERQKLFGVYRMMKSRCTDQRDPSFKNYGGRSISISPEWFASFETFLHDMGPRPIGTSLDRIDNDAGYSRDNCRWADRKTQNNNRRNCVSKRAMVHPEWQSWMDESAYTHSDARRELGLANGTFYRRIAKAPTLIDKLAMRSLYEGLEPFNLTTTG